jgi:hypothetical protein
MVEVFKIYFSNQDMSWVIAKDMSFTEDNYKMHERVTVYRSVDGSPSYTKFNEKYSKDLFVNEDDARAEIVKRNMLLLNTFDKVSMIKSIQIKNQAREFCKLNNVSITSMAEYCGVTYRTFTRPIISFELTLNILKFFNVYLGLHIRLSDLIDVSIDGKSLDIDNSLDFVTTSDYDINFNNLYYLTNTVQVAFTHISGVERRSFYTLANAKNIADKKLPLMLYVYYIGKRLNPNLVFSDYIELKGR